MFGSAGKKLVMLTVHWWYGTAPFHPFNRIHLWKFVLPSLTGLYVTVEHQPMYAQARYQRDNHKCQNIVGDDRERHLCSPSFPYSVGVIVRRDRVDLSNPASTAAGWINVVRFERPQTATTFLLPALGYEGTQITI